MSGGVPRLYMFLLVCWLTTVGSGLPFVVFSSSSENLTLCNRSIFTVLENISVQPLYAYFETAI